MSGAAMAGVFFHLVAVFPSPEHSWAVFDGGQTEMLYSCNFATFDGKYL
jgi:hypothetical protein